MSRLALTLSFALLSAVPSFGSQALKLVPIPALPAQSPVQGPPLPEILPVGAPAQTQQNEILPTTPTTSSQSTPSGKGAPNDPFFPLQWDMQAIDMPGAWAQFLALKPAPAPVTVAVLDTGYVDSPELRGRVINGYDFVSDVKRSGDGDGRDKDATGLGEYAYHAEVIGNIIAAAHDKQGMAGINPLARILQVRVAGTDGMIDPLDLIDGIRWAAGLTVKGVPANRTPAKVINLSLYADFIPLTGCDPRIQKAVDEVTARGVLIVTGAANDGANADGYSPAGCRNVLTVTSATQDGRRPAYANWGKSVALSAPGGEPGHGVLVSSLSGVSGQRSPDGTSFAAPHVTGVASLLLSVRPKLTPAQLRDLLTRTTTPFARACDPDPLKTCGSGMLNASAALAKALASPVGK